MSYDEENLGARDNFGCPFSEVSLFCGGSVNRGRRLLSGWTFKTGTKKKTAVEAEHNIVKKPTLQEVNQLIFGKGRCVVELGTTTRKKKLCG